MNYYEWSLEYTQTAQELEKTIARLKRQRAHAGESEKKELNERLSLYRSCRKECLETALRLMERHRGVA